MRKYLFFSIILIYSCFSTQAQTPQNYSLVDNLNPVTPTAYQFQKYTDLPVSEYTGIPNISIPLYEIDEDGVKIPLELSYNAAGIKVNEEASWVGLGWDMTIGSIIEQISDQDDYAVATVLQPDFYNTEEPYLFPFKYLWALPPSGYGDHTCNYGCTGPIEINTPNINNGIMIYTAEYAPFGGDYGYHTGQDYKNFFDSHRIGDGGYSIDSEPDIFTANFLGHSFKFLRDPISGQVVLLDKKGYQVTRVGQVWKVLVPSGDEYDFALKDVVTSSSSGITFTSSVSESDPEPSSNIWMLTQIITKNKKVITLNYKQTVVQNCYPSVTQRGILSTLQSTVYTGDDAEWQAFCATSEVTSSGASSGVFSNVSFSTEQYTYLSSIVFPKGTVNFNLSARNDLQGGLKLDSLSITSNQQVQSYKFNYSYFDATAVGGHRFPFADSTSFGNCPLYRLKLLSIQDKSGATHTFTYNSTPLPAKNSFAVDYWGYYNGDTGNATFVPNATQFNQTGWLTNTDNHSANVTYTQAGILTQIQYPTGGSVNFTYALNQFTNYWVPDYADNTNTISSGNGLRVQAVTWQDASSNQLKQTTYTYNGGIASLPLNFFRNYNYSVSPSQTLIAPNSYTLQRIYSINETNMSGNYTANPFASFNGVGYNQVIETEVNTSGIANGKTVSNYYNQPDLVYNSITNGSQSDPTLPAYKNPADSAENGSLRTELYYDSSNNLLKKTSNIYSKVMSPLYYGARLMEYGSLVRFISGNVGFDQNILPQSIVGYYPIFDFETLLTSSTETDYFGADSVATTTSTAYDQYDQPASTVKTNSTYTITTDYFYPYSPPTNAVLDSMVAHNRLADIVAVDKYSPDGTSSFNRNYQQLNHLFLPTVDYDLAASDFSTPPNVTSYDQFDAGNGNLFQYTKNGSSNCLLWDYNKEYVIAEAKNALYTNIAYTSFEADGTGRWKFTGTTMPDAAAPTGEKVYSLANGNIYRDSLDATKTYVVSYWSKSGAQSVNGNATPKQGYTFNGYTYYEHSIATPTGGTITVTGTGTIDELRLYPSDAQMTTYTFAPLVGITSESSAGGKIAYYEYDGSMRLLDIRDQNKHILKAFCYNYAGQPTNCGLNITYSNQEKDSTFTRNNCTTGYVGSPVGYDVPIGKYTSTMSVQDANNQALADVVANGQANANANGSCVIPPTITSVGYGGQQKLVQVIFTSIPSCYTATISYLDLTTNIGSSNSVPCTSPQFVSVPIVGHTYRFTVTCYSPAFGSGITSAPVDYLVTE